MTKRLATPPKEEQHRIKKKTAPSQNAASSQGPRPPRPLPTGSARYQHVGSPVGTGSFGRVWIALDKAPLSVVAHRISR